MMVPAMMTAVVVISVAEVVGVAAVRLLLML